MKVTESRVSLLIALAALLVSAIPVFFQFFHRAPDLWAIATNDYVDGSNYVFELRINNIGNALATIERANAFLLAVPDGRSPSSYYLGKVIQENVPFTIKEGESVVVKVIISSNEINSILKRTALGKYGLPVVVVDGKGVERKSEEVVALVQLEFTMTDHQGKPYQAILPAYSLYLRPSNKGEFNFVDFNVRVGGLGAYKIL